MADNLFVPINEKISDNGWTTRQWIEFFQRLSNQSTTGANSGDFDGPDGSTLNAVVLFADETGKLGKNSVVLISNAGVISGVTGLSITGNISITGNVDGRDVSADGAVLDSHVADSTIHFTEGSIDHTALQNVGTNTHAQIDTHIADSTIHFLRETLAQIASNSSTNAEQTFKIDSGTKVIFSNNSNVTILELEESTSKMTLYSPNGVNYWSFSVENGGILRSIGGSDHFVIQAPLQSTSFKNSLSIFSSDAFAIDIGAGIGLGGKYITSNDTIGHFALIAGRKENSTSNDFAGYFVIETRPNASDPIERVRVKSSGETGINTTTPRRKLDVLDSSNPQIRATHTDDSKYVEIQADANGYGILTPSGGVLSFPAGLRHKASTKVNNYNVAATDYYLVMDGSSSTVTFTMPASPADAEVHKVCCQDDTNTCDINWNGKTFYGDASNFNLYQGESYEFFYDGTEWKAI